MRTETPQTIYLKDYTPPAWWVETVDLRVAIHDGYAEVSARMTCRRNAAVAPAAPLVRDG
jgi:aminopeptidase N